MSNEVYDQNEQAFDARVTEDREAAGMNLNPIPAQRVTPQDAAGRDAVTAMSDRALLEECVTRMRMVEDLTNALADHPMLTAIMNGQNPMAVALGFGRG